MSKKDFWNECKSILFVSHDERAHFHWSSFATPVCLNNQKEVSIFKVSSKFLKGKFMLMEDLLHKNMNSPQDK